MGWTLNRSGRRFAGSMQDEAPDAVILAAAKVGGNPMPHNTYPADSSYEKQVAPLMIECNHHPSGPSQPGVRQLLFLGSSCIYPARGRPADEGVGAADRHARKPPTNPMPSAKIAGIKLCESYNRQHGTDLPLGMPTKPLWPGRQFSIPIIPTFLPALIRRFHEAAQKAAASGGYPLGHRHPAGANSCMSTTWPMPACS